MTESDAREAAVYEMLRTAADNFAPCPTNVAMAKTMGINENSVKLPIARLVQSGKISVAYAAISTKGNAGPRKITITETGRSTNWSRVRTCAAPPPPTPPDDPWPPNCFARHNIEPGDTIGRSPKRETIVPRIGSLA